MRSWKVCDGDESIDLLNFTVLPFFSIIFTESNVTLIFEPTRKRKVNHNFLKEQQIFKDKESDF